ncbi:hypothetical protein Goklo_002951, partial [Gossypium klotzschianum]|nr:hypothetical protein [Gossypium klotzschianum]
YVWSSITVDRKLLEGSEFLARGQYRWGCKLDPKLINALIERWRPETCTSYFPCGECTITLEDVQLQLRLPMEGFILTRSVQSADWGAICYDLLGAILNNIYGGWIEMSWL